MTFRTRLIIGHATLLAITIAIGVAALVAMRASNFRLKAVARELTTDMLAIHRLQFHAEQLVATSRGHLLTGDPETLQRFDTIAAGVDALLGELAPRSEGVARAARGYVRAARQAAQQRTATGDPQTIVPFFERTLAPARARFEDEVSRLVQRERDVFEAGAADARRSARHARAIVGVATVLAVLLSVALTWLSIRGLNARYAREREATELARRAVEQRDELLAVVSHDLRSPLQAIAMGAAYLEAAVGASPEARRSLTVITGAADRMRHLIDELLDAAKLEHGAAALRRARCEAGALLEAAALLFRPRAAEANVTLACRAEPGCAASADRERVLQVLSNLVGNALRLTPAGGQITLAAERVPGATKLLVTDTGPGIPEAQIPHLFERHWQGATERKGSLGLGLYICRKIVEAHGGCIGVDTEVGRGSTFWFTLPDADDAGPGAAGDDARA